jgi:tRNA-Thr(GGU) m(6)t(6)A37 methyltransferase TsaA
VEGPGGSGTFVVRPIGVVRSPYLERYGTPRQATVTRGVVGEGPVDARIVLDPAVVPREALRDLEGFGRIWVIAWLDRNTGWRPTVVPTRGPKVRRGVLATRSPHRPNALGLTATELVGVDGLTLHVRGIDLLDGTPVLDVKPYVPYADAFPDAASGWVGALDEDADAPDRPTRAPARRRDG